LKQRLFWLSCDGWTFNGRAVSWVLSVVQESDHTSDHLAEEIREILKAWNILMEEIEGLMADNTNAMSALACELGLPFKGCNGHKFNLVVNHSLEV